MASQHIKLTVRNQLKQIMTVSAPMHQIQLKSRNGLHGPLIRVYADRDQALLASQSLSGPFAPPAEATDAH